MSPKQACRKGRHIAETGMLSKRTREAGRRGECGCTRGGACLAATLLAAALCQPWGAFREACTRRSIGLAAGARLPDIGKRGDRTPPPLAAGQLRSIGQKEDAVKADRAKVEKLLKTAKGQLDGILRMVEEDRYCIDISNQILAAQAVLNRANKEILKAHMEMCVNHAVETGDSQQKMAELYSLLDKILK